MRPLVLSALEPVDSDVDLDDPVQRRELRREHGAVLAVIAAGGIIGSLARYRIGLWWPARPAGMPWATVTINLTGCLLLGALMVLLTERLQPHRWVRPFLGTGVLGGFTTFSAFTVDTVLLLRADRPVTAAGYLVITGIGGVLAAAAGMTAAGPGRSATGTDRVENVDPDLEDPVDAEQQRSR